MTEYESQGAADPVENETFRQTIQALYRRSRDHVDDELAPILERTWRYFDGKVDAEPAFFVGHDLEGKKVFHGSKVVIRECWDKVQAVLPDLARVFLGSSEVVQYVPKKPEDEETSAQATDYANYVLWSQNDGEQLLLDALILWLVKFVAIKVYWQTAEKVEKHNFEGVSYQTLLAWRDDPEIVEIEAEARQIIAHVQQNERELLAEQHKQALIAHAQQQQAMQMAQPGAAPPMQPPPPPPAPSEQMVSGLMPQPVPMIVFDGTVTRLVRDGKICIEVLPHEEFVIDPDAQKEDAALFIGTDTWRTVSELVEMGIPFDLAQEKISGDNKSGRHTAVEVARRGRTDRKVQHDTPDPALDYVRTVEACARADGDGDGRAERYRVLMLGDDPEPVAAVEADDLYYIVASPFRRPHEPVGAGLAEVEIDLQDQLTALARGILNSLNRANNPREVVQDTDTGAYEDLKSPLSGPIRAMSPASIAVHQIPFVGANVMPVIQYFEERSASRTGVSPAGQGLDPSILKGQTVEGAQAIVTAPQSRIEFLAREFAAGVMRPLFKAILKLAVRFQDKKAVFRLRNRWVEVDPRSWNADMDAEIKVGLGTGTRSEKFMALMVLKGTQEALLMQGSPLVSVKEYRETLTAMCEMLGFKDASRFIKDVSDEDIAAHAQQQVQAAQQQMQMAVQAKMAEEQAKAQAQAPIEQAKIQAQAQMEALKAQQQAQLEQMKLSSQAEVEAVKAQHEQQRQALEIESKERLAQLETQSKMQIEQMKGQIQLQIAEREAELERERMQLDFHLKTREQEMEAKLEEKKMKAGSRDGQGNMRTSTKGP